MRSFAHYSVVAIATMLCADCTRIWAQAPPPPSLSVRRNAQGEITNLYLASPTAEELKGLADESFRLEHLRIRHVDLERYPFLVPLIKSPRLRSLSLRGCALDK